MNSIIAKTILTVYTSLSMVIDEIERLIYDKAVSAHNLGGSTFEQTTHQVDTIFKLIEKKKNLLTLKTICDEALTKLCLQQRQLLSMRYYERLMPHQIVAKLAIPSRTYYRLNNKALQEFAHILTSLGYNENWFIKAFLDQQWIKRIYNEYLTKGRSDMDLPKCS